MYNIYLGDILWGSSGHIWVAGLSSTWEVCDTCLGVDIWILELFWVSIDYFWPVDLSFWWGYSTFGVLNVWLILSGGYLCKAWGRTLEFILLNNGMSFDLWTFARGCLGRGMECVCLGREECFRDMHCYRDTHTGKRNGRSSACLLYTSDAADE